MAKEKKRRARSGRIGQKDYQVFVSHATADKWIAKVLCERIETTTATTFRDDRDIGSGDDIPGEIRRELVRSKEMVILLSPESVDRPWVLLEAGAFWGRRRNARIVAVLCHVQLDTIPDMIKSKKAIPLNDFDSYVTELAGRVRAAKK